jgi:MFS superfamily sulfate permease-like transporter
MESTFLLQIVLLLSGICFGVSIACLAFVLAVVKMFKHDE